MMRLWKEEYTRPTKRGGSVAMSVVVHSALIVVAVIATNPPQGMVSSLYELANRVIYVAPPVREPPRPGTEERLKYTEGSPIGSGAGFARSAMPSTERPSDQIAFSRPGDLGTDVKNTPQTERITGTDSVFTEIEVDSAATTDPTSAAPQYPLALLKLGIEGSAKVRYVVDSTGAADPMTLEIVKATRIEFAVAVREALPLMHFVPARVGPRRVRQLVEQEFNFRIAKPDTAAAPPLKKPPQ